MFLHQFAAERRAVLGAVSQLYKIRSRNSRLYEIIGNIRNYINAFLSLSVAVLVMSVDTRYNHLKSSGCYMWQLLLTYKNSEFSPTVYLYVFRMILERNSDYFPKPQLEDAQCRGDKRPT